MQKYLYNDLYKLEEIHWWHKAKRNLVIYFLSKYLDKKNNEILDFGCGTGKNLESFSKYGTTWGIDNSPEAIKFCKKRGLKNIILGSIENSKLKKKYFDAVTALDVLEHVDDEKSLKAIYKLLKPSGIIIATVPAFPMLWSKWDEVLHHKRRYTKKTISTQFQKANFRILKVSYTYSFLFLPTLIIRNIKKVIYKNYYPSDFKISNNFANFVLLFLANLEKILLVNFYIPFGTSLIIVGQKKYEK